MSVVEKKCFVVWFAGCICILKWGDTRTWPPLDVSIKVSSQ